MYVNVAGFFYFTPIALRLSRSTLLNTTVPLKLRCEVFKNILSGNGILLKSRTLTFGYVLSESNNLLASSGFSNL